MKLKVFALIFLAFATSGCVMPGDLARMQQGQEVFETRQGQSLDTFRTEVAAAAKLSEERRKAAVAVLSESMTRTISDLKDGLITEEESSERIRMAAVADGRRAEDLIREQEGALAAAEERYEKRYEAAASKFNEDLARTIAASEQRTQAMIQVIQGTVGTVKDSITGMKSGQVGMTEGLMGLLGTGIGTYFTVQGVRNRKYTKAGMAAAAAPAGSFMHGYPPQVVSAPPGEPVARV